MTALAYTAWLVGLATSLPAPWYPPGKSPETPEQYRARVTTIAQEAAAVSLEPPPGWHGSTASLGVAVLVKTWWESGRWRIEVHDGRQTGDSGRARCLGQIHPAGDFVTIDEWRASTGTDSASTRLCLQLTARVLAYHCSRCVASDVPLDTRQIARVFAGYGTGRSCSPSLTWAVRRARMWATLRRRR